MRTLVFEKDRKPMDGFPASSIHEPIRLDTHDHSTIDVVISLDDCENNAAVSIMINIAYRWDTAVVKLVGAIFLSVHIYSYDNNQHIPKNFMRGKK